MATSKTEACLAPPRWQIQGLRSDGLWPTTPDLKTPGPRPHRNEMDASTLACLLVHLKPGHIRSLARSAFARGSRAQGSFFEKQDEHQTDTGQGRRDQKDRRQRVRHLDPRAQLAVENRAIQCDSDRAAKRSQQIG